MKTKLKLLTFLCVPLMLVGCTGEGGNNPSGNETEGGENNNNSNNQKEHTHEWDEDSWEYDSGRHWHKCKVDSCQEKKDETTHAYGDWVIDSYATDTVRETQNQWGWGTTTETVKQNGSKHRICTVCGYKQTGIVDDYKPEPSEYTPKYNREGYHIFDEAPEIRFTTTESLDFATKPRKSSNIEPWEVTGTFTTAKCGIDYDIGSVTGGLKVRGNYTTDYEKKGFRIKFDSKVNLFGLNNGKKFKKWVLFADVKDNSMLRNAMSFFMARELSKDSNVFVTDFTPAHLYINNQYWGLYLLAEQKEAKDGRLNIPELKNDTYTGTDIGYSFELDRYAEEESKKGLDGDPTFTVTYKPKTDNKVLSSENHYQCEGKEITTYTMLSDIGPRETSTKSNDQLRFIKTRVEQLYEILYRAANNQGLKEIVNNQLVDSTETDVKKCLEKSFNIDSFLNSYILNEVVVNPDVGYSSFYLTIDCSATGDQKLRLDNPWDFDTALGIRAGTLENSQGMYAAECSNMWLRLMYKCSFFKNLVKARWNEIREAKLFERAIDMIEDYSISYKNEYKKNFDKWPKTMGSNPETNHETRSIVQTFKTERQAEQLLYTWFTARIDYLEGVFGNGRPSIASETGTGVNNNNENNNENTNNENVVDYAAFKANANKTRLEAENGARNGECTVKNKAGENISGEYYVGDLNGHQGSSVTFTFNSSKAQEALLTVGLSARTDADHNLTDLFDISVNDTVISSSAVVAQGNGTDYHCWTSVDAGMINLKAGNNTIVFTARAVSTNFDYIDIFTAK